MGAHPRARAPAPAGRPADPGVAVEVDLRAGRVIAMRDLSPAGGRPRHRAATYTPGVLAAAVELDGLVVRYGATTAVAGLSMTVPTGAVTALLGPNGAGKTTTVEVCEGLRRPDAGRVRVLGADPHRRAGSLRARVGVMLQDGGGAYAGVRAGELLAHVARLHARPLDVGVLVERLGLQSCGRTPWRRLSGGQRQRVSLALALVGRPELVVLDEPTAGMDPQTRMTTWQLVRELRDDGVSVLLTTHLMDEAERLADEVRILDAGRLVAAGPPAVLTAADAGSLVQFSGPPRLDLAALLAALPEGSQADELSPGRYRVSGNVGPQLLATLTAWCAARGVMPQGLEVGRRTLEDVFLELTGKELRR